MIGQLARVDVKIGTRGHTYSIYLLVGVAYGLMVMAFPEQYRPTIVPILILLEPGLVGSMFVGTTIFGEKKDGTIGALAVTPLDWRDYILAKAFVMALYSIPGAVLIIGIGTGSVKGLPCVIVGTLLVSIVYTLLGIAISSKYRDLDDYFVPLLGLLVISLLPFAHYHGLLAGEIWKVLYVIPSYPALHFFKVPFEEISTNTLMWSAVALLTWAGVAYHIAKTRFCRHAVEGLR